MLPIVIKLLLAIHVIVSLLIVLLVLMQRPKNEGLGAAFGGGMTDNLFGAQTTNVLQTITRWLGGIFFALTLLLSYLYVKQTMGKSSLQQRLLSAPAAAAGASGLATPAPEPGSEEAAKAAIMEQLREATSNPAPAVEATPAPEMPVTATPAPAPAPAATPQATP